MHEPETIPKKQTHYILWDLKIQTDHLIPERRLNLVLINKKKGIRHQVDLPFHRIIRKIKESEMTYKYLILCRELKKAVKYELDGDTKSNLYTWNGLQRPEKKSWGIRNLRKNRDHLVLVIVKISTTNVHKSIRLSHETINL